MRAYHATNEQFDEFDFDRLGEFTEANGADEDAVRIARIGVWLSDRPLAKEMGADIQMEVELDMDGWEVAEVSLEQLWQGTDIPEADIYIVEDSEFGCTSYIVTEGAKSAMTIIAMTIIR